MQYSKDENKYWLNKISNHILEFEESDIKIGIEYINQKMSKKPLIAREFVLEIMKLIVNVGDVRKIELIDAQIKENFLDKRHYHILSKIYLQNGALVRAYEILDKITDDHKNVNLKNEIVIEIGKFLCGENDIESNHIKVGTTNSEKSLHSTIIKIMNRHSDIYRFEYNRILESKKSTIIKPKEVINSLLDRHNFGALDLFIDDNIKNIKLIEQLERCKLISTSGIVGRILVSKEEFNDLCLRLVNICENLEREKREIVLNSFLENRNIIPVKTAEEIIKYVKLIRSELGNLTLLRAAKLCEKVNKLKDGIFILDKLSTESALIMKKEFEKKLSWLERGYDIQSIIKSHDEIEIDADKNKILYFVHSDLPFVTSGYTIRTKHVVNALSNQGYEIEVTSRWGFPLDRDMSYYEGEMNNKYTDENNIHHNFYPSKKGMKEFHNTEYITEGVKKLLNKCLQFKPSIIISASDHVTGLIGLITSRILKIPFFYEMRGLWAYTRASNNSEYERSYDFALRLKLEKQCALEADKVISISNNLKKLIKKWGVEESKINLLPNGIGKVEYPVNKRVFNPDLINIGYIGSIVPYEGLITTIKAIKAMSDIGKKNIPKFIIVGEGSEKQNLEKYVFDNKLEKFIEFRGRIGHGEINYLYDEIDCVILPRLSTLVTDIVPPLKPLEAIANGKIVISSKIGPHNELFDKIKNSFRFEHGDVKSQIKAIEEFINYKGDHQNIVKNSFQYIIKNRNYNKMIKEIAKEIKTMMKKILKIIV